MYGRSAAGTSETIATHQPEATTSARPAASSCAIRRRTGVGAHTRYTAANTGTTRNACSILVRNPVPTRAAASTSQPVRACSSARVIA